MAVQPIPEGYPTVTPYLNVAGAADAIDFYCKVLGASERMRMDGPGGSIGHAELDLGGSVIMLADESTEMGNKSPSTLGGTPVSLMVYVEDVDSTYSAAIAAGATEIQAIEDKFYGDRSGMFKDPWGHEWTSPRTSRTCPKPRWSAASPRCNRADSSPAEAAESPALPRDDQPGT